MTLLLTPLLAGLAQDASPVTRPSPDADNAPLQPIPARPALELLRDGSIRDSAGVIAAAVLGTPKTTHCEFGLPPSPPLSYGPAADIPTAGSTQWEQSGIRYRQTALVTSLRPDAPSPSVLMVQLTGENLARDYADASAAFAVRFDGQTVDLEWRHGLVHALNRPGQPLVGVIDIGAEGIQESTGSRLRFHGHMPPGTSGAMTFKIPLERITGEEDLNRLHDLEFDEEYRRLARQWKSASSVSRLPGIIFPDP